MVTTNEASHWVYVLASRSGLLSVGTTSDLERRMAQRTQHDGPGARSADRLVYAEPYATIDAALHRERQLRSWSREQKAALISADNPAWSTEPVA